MSNPLELNIKDIQTKIKFAIKSFNCLEINYLDERILNINVERIKIFKDFLLIDCIYLKIKIYLKEILKIEGYFFNNDEKFHVLEKYNRQKAINFYANSKSKYIKIFYGNFKQKIIEKRTISFNEEFICCYDALKDYKVFFKLEYLKIDCMQEVFL